MYAMLFQKILAFIGIVLLGVAIADDDRRIKGDVNVYRSHVKIIAYNAHGHKGVATSDDDRLKKRSINVYRSHVNIVGYNSPGYKVVVPNETEGKPFRPTSCVDYLRRGISQSGIYRLYDQRGKGYAAYCDMNSELDTAWTMVTSWSTSNRHLAEFRKIPFKYNAPQNEDALNWDLYRLSLARMRFLQTHSTHWRATCSYPTHGIDFRDYLRGNFKDFNIVDFLGSSACKKVEYVNIRGHVGTHLTAPFWQVHNTYTLHIDSTYTHCQFKTMKAGAVSSEDNFGHYWHINSKFRCTQGDQSTTQWWFGAHP